VYDRRIGGREYVFGNQGALYKNAMTWFDHETGSVWSQVTGEALSGPLAGARLRQIPAAIETWASWRSTHPDTVVLVTGDGYIPEPVTRNFVIGIRIGGASAAFRFSFVVDRAVVNDRVGGVPLAIYARADRTIRVFSREVGGRVVTLEVRGDRLVDPATGSAWSPASGQGISGSLAGEPLAPIAWASSYGWAWKSFYPGARIVG